MTTRFTVTAACNRCFRNLPPVHGIGVVALVCPHCGETWTLELRSEPMSTREDVPSFPALPQRMWPDVPYHPIIDMIHKAIDEAPELHLGDSLARRRGRLRLVRSAA